MDEEARQVTPSAYDVALPKATQTLQGQGRGKSHPVALALSRHLRLQIATTERRGSTSSIDSSAAGTKTLFASEQALFCLRMCIVCYTSSTGGSRHLVTLRRRFSAGIDPAV